MLNDRMVPDIPLKQILHLNMLPNYNGHIILYHATQDAGMPNHGDIDRKKENVIFNTYIALKFGTICQTGRVVHMLNFKGNLPIHFQHMSNQIFGYFLCFYLLFTTLCIIHHKTQTQIPIELKLGTLNMILKSNHSTNFGENPCNFTELYMTNYFCKLRSSLQGKPL